MRMCRRACARSVGRTGTRVCTVLVLVRVRTAMDDAVHFFQVVERLEDLRARSRRALEENYKRRGEERRGEKRTGLSVYVADARI